MHIEPLQNDDCFAIRQAARRISHFYERYLSESGLTPSQYCVLSVLEQDPGLTMAQLSAALAVERTTLVRALKPLLKSGFVAARHEGKAKRRLLFDLTECGRAKLAEASVSWQAAQEEFERRIGSQRAAQLRAELFRVPGDIATT